MKGMHGIIMIVKGIWTGNWKVPWTRRLESLRYVAQTFLSAGSGDFPVARFNGELPKTANLGTLS